MEALKKCFNFKSRCLYSQGYTFTFVHSKHSAKLDIKIVYQDKKKNDNIISTSDDQKVCRLCMAVLKRLILPHKEEGDVSFEKMIEKCIPELQVQNVTKKHIICAACRECLQNFFGFITNCEIVEGTIKKYCESLGTNGERPIDLNDILQLISKIVCEGDDPVYIIKTEETYCEDEENVIEIELKDEHFMNTEVQMCNNELQFLSYDMVICEGGNGGDKVQGNCCEEIDNEVEHIDDNFMEMENQKYNGEKKNAVTYEENINIDMIKVEGSSCEETENEMKCQNENFVEIKDQEINSELQFSSNMLNYEEENIGVDIVQTDGKSCEKVTNEVGHKNVSFMEMMDQIDNIQMKFSLTCDENFTEIENQFNRELQENCCEGIESEVKDKNENIVEEKFLPNEEIVIKTEPQEFDSFRTVKAEEIEIKTEPQEFSSFQDDAVLPQPEATNNIHERKCLKLYQCDSCLFESNHKAGISKHKWFHKNVSEITVPSEIPVHQHRSCSYETKYKWHIKIHDLQHKKASEVVMYPCKSCSYKTEYKSNLKRHKSLAHVKSS